METNGERRAELYLRGDTYGTFDAQQAVLNRMRTLEAEDVLDAASVDGGWQRVRTIDEDGRAGALATYREFDSWARRNGYSLGPAFEERQRAYMGLERLDDVVVFPVVTLAMYEDDQLRGVFPCSDGDQVYRVNDCLDALEAGDEEWFARFDSITVDRDSPWLDVDVSAD